MTAGLTDTHAGWIEDRKLNVETAVAMGLTSRKGMLAFPYYAPDGRELYVKLRGMAKKQMFCDPPGVDQAWLWNERCLAEAPAQTDMLIITEGECDAIAFAQIGQRYVVSVPSGAASTAEGARSKALKCLTVNDGDGPILKAAIQKFSRVLVAVDCDVDGLLLRAAIVDIIGDEFCWVPAFPDGCKDANDVLKLKDGAEALRRLVAGAAPCRSDGFLPFSEQSTAKPRTISIGLPYLEDHLKLIRPEFMVVGGEAGHGKSTIAQGLLFNLLAENDDLKASIFHGEGARSIPVQRAMRFFCSHFYRDSVHLTEKIKAERDFWIGDRLAFIAPPQDQLPTFEWLLWAMEQQALYRGRSVFMIDPWNEIVHNKPKGSSTTEYVGDCIVKLKRLADRLRLILIVVHHVTKPKESHRPPSRYDLADSAHWANKADHVVLAWKPSASENTTRIEIAKSKDHETMGRPGCVWVGMSSKDFRLFRKDPPSDQKPAAGQAEAPDPKARKKNGKRSATAAVEDDGDPVAEPVAMPGETIQ